MHFQFRVCISCPAAPTLASHPSGLGTAAQAMHAGHQIGAPLQPDSCRGIRCTSSTNSLAAGTPSAAVAAAGARGRVEVSHVSLHPAATPP